MLYYFRGVFEEWFLSCYLRVSLSLDPPYIFLFFTELVSDWFFENKLENGLSHVWKRREKV